jgi:hypothetical protein
MKSEAEYRKFLSDQTVSECSCEKCVKMCKSRVCWGTPEDIQKLIDKKPETIDRLMIDWWCDGDDGGDIEIICPAFIGYEKTYAPSWPSGRCAFLDNNDRCEIHALKPTEGKTASCKGSKSSYPVHEAVAMLWNTDAGRGLVDSIREMWRGSEVEE